MTWGSGAHGTGRCAQAHMQILSLPLSAITEVLEVQDSLQVDCLAAGPPLGVGQK